MVKRIIDAGETVLITHGYDGASTNRIADAARISPGSLYQYFPNKDAIVTAVIDRYNNEVATVVRKYVFENLTQPPEVGIPATISVLLDALGNRPELLRAVVEQTPRLSTSDTVFAFEQQIAEVAHMALVMRMNSLPENIDPASTAWMLVRTVEHLSIRYTLDQPAISRDRFLADITRLVRNFFHPDPPPESGPSPATRPSRDHRE